MNKNEFKEWNIKFNTNIFRIIIEKAKKNGYNNKLLKYDVFLDNEWIVEDNFITDDCNYLHINVIIFSHDFAKAFWGEEIHYLTDTCDDMCLHCQGHPYETNTKYCWQWHLQQMILNKNPLSYILKNSDLNTIIKFKNVISKKYDYGRK